MKCPIDDTDLVISERQGIEIDYCPKCRGVWLDRGELDKLIERTADALPPSQQQYPETRPRSHHGRDSGYRPKKRKSFLNELFDF